MLKLNSLKALIAAAIITVTATVASPSASAGSGSHTPGYYYKTITVYETSRKPYEYSVIKYDHCGRPYTVTRTGFRTVQVPMTRKVLVRY